MQFVKHRDHPLTDITYQSLIDPNYRESLYRRALVGDPQYNGTLGASATVAILKKCTPALVASMAGSAAAVVEKSRQMLERGENVTEQQLAEFASDEAAKAIGAFVGCVAGAVWVATMCDVGTGGAGVGTLCAGAGFIGALVGSWVGSKVGPLLRDWLSKRPAMSAEEQYWAARVYYHGINRRSYEDRYRWMATVSKGGPRNGQHAAWVELSELVEVLHNADCPPERRPFPWIEKYTMSGGQNWDKERQAHLYYTLWRLDTRQYVDLGNQVHDIGMKAFGREEYKAQCTPTLESILQQFPRGAALLTFHMACPKPIDRQCVFERQAAFERQMGKTLEDLANPRSELWRVLNEMGLWNEGRPLVQESSFPWLTTMPTLLVAAVGAMLNSR